MSQIFIWLVQILFPFQTMQFVQLLRIEKGGVWIGTFYGGVNYLPQENKSFEKFYPTGLPGALNGNVVREIRADSYGNIWIGTEDAGLIKLDHQTRLFSSFPDGYSQVKYRQQKYPGVAC